MLIACDKCSTLDLVELSKEIDGKWYCSQCRPHGRWHDLFPKETFNPSLHRVVNRPSGVGLDSCQE